MQYWFSYYEHKGLSLFHLIQFFAFFLTLQNLQSQTVEVTGNDITAIHTDYGGYFTSSTSSVSSTETNSAHNLIGFEFDGVTYSTGVGDAILTTQGVTYTAANFIAFSPTTAASNSAGMGSLDDGALNSVTPIYATGTTDVSQYITDGSNGLGMSTYANNVGGTFVFELDNLDPNTVNDGIPDLIYFNNADPSTANVTFTFRNSIGDQIGNQVETLEGSGRATIAVFRTDRYETLTGNQLGMRNTTKTIEGFAIELSSFDDGSFDLSTARTLELQLPVQADPPFVAYNTTAFSTNFVPVELSYFRLTKKADEVHLAWETVSELNNDFFQIERSRDAIIWEKIGTVDGFGTTNQVQNYEFVDQNPFEGWSYYRLKQVDFDGTFEYSEIRSVFRTVSITKPFRVYPQPSLDWITIEGVNLDSTDEIGLANSLGQFIKPELIFLERNKYQMNVSQLPKGLYWLYFKSSDGVFRKEIIVQ